MTQSNAYLQVMPSW